MDEKDGEKEELQEGKRINIKGYIDKKIFVVEIVINNYLSLCQP